MGTNKSKASQPNHFQPSYPLVLPPADGATPRWQERTKYIESYPEVYNVRELPSGLKIVTLKDPEKIKAQIEKMCKLMYLTPGTTLLDFDPSQPVPPTLNSNWTDKGFKVCDHGTFIVKWDVTNHVFQYPFIEV
jgi:hypothetical protein